MAEVERTAGDGKTCYSVAAYGVPDFEKRILDRIFSLSTQRNNRYVLTTTGTEREADILLVDRDNPAALAAAEGTPGGKPVVCLAKQPATDARDHVRRPIVATRLLGVLDRVVEVEIATRGVPAEPAQAPPASPGSAGTATAGTASAEAATAAEALRYRALVVDDSLPVRKQIGIALEAANVAPEFAECGERALELIGGGGYDIVFLDVMMPGLDGYDVCKSIKRDRAKKHIPVVMLTGKSSPFDKVKGRLSGCDAYLTKPVSRRDFVNTLKKYLKQPIVFE